MIYNATEWDLKNLKGIIYVILNLVNNKRYIGQSHHPFYKRYNLKWWKTKGVNRHLKNSVEKYGPNCFKIEILQINLNEKELNYWEAFYIDYFKSTNREYGYNITSGGDNFLLSEEHKLRLSLSKRTTPEKFEQKARKIFGDKFDYSDVIIGRSEEKIKIKCNKHNKCFLITMQEHLKCDGGCKTCANEKIAEFNKIPYAELVEKSKKLYPNKFGYLEDTFIHYDRKTRALKLKCLNCENIFKVTVQNHFKENCLGSCQKCAVKARKQNNPMPFLEFVEKGNKKYNNEFIYFAEGYKDCFSDVKIIHKNCGTEFIQRVNRHLKYEIGCPCCAAKDRLNRVRSIKCIDINTNSVIKTYKSRKLAANDLKLNIEEIDKAAQNKLSYGGYKWEYMGKDYEFKNIKQNNDKEYNYYV